MFHKVPARICKKGTVSRLIIRGIVPEPLSTFSHHLDGIKHISLILLLLACRSVWVCARACPCVEIDGTSRRIWMQILVIQIQISNRHYKMGIHSVGLHQLMQMLHLEGFGCKSFPSRFNSMISLQTKNLPRSNQSASFNVPKN